VPRVSGTKNNLKREKEGKKRAVAKKRSTFVPSGKKKVKDFKKIKRP
jgi:hypothetical protein